MQFFRPWRRLSSKSGSKSGSKDGPKGRRKREEEESSSQDTTRSQDILRAARILAVRSRREASGIFSGSYASAFRGGGLEFDESRPYVQGDDIRNLDWNAMARTGEPFVKRFREERDESLLLAIDVSASMAFGTTARTKAETAAHAAALMAAAAGGAGDRVGLLTFDEQIRSEIAPALGAAHTWRLVEAIVAGAREPAKGTDLSPAIEALQRSKNCTVAMLLSDFRVGGTALQVLQTEPPGGAPLVRLARERDLVCAILHDPREEQLPRVGLVRVEDPECSGTLLLNTNSASVRARYRRAWATRAATLERSLRSSGADVFWLRTDRDPLQTLMHFFRGRAGNASHASAPHARRPAA